MIYKISVQEMLAFLKNLISVEKKVQEDLPELLPSEEIFQENVRQVAPHSTPRREENGDEISVIDLCTTTTDDTLPFIGGEQQSDFSLPFIGGEQRPEETILLSDEDCPGKPLEETITLESTSDPMEENAVLDGSNDTFFNAPDEEIFGEYGIAKSSEYKIILKANVSIKMFLY